MTQLISCQLHDYIEITCLYGYRVRLTLKNGEIVEGKAVDTAVDEERREYLLMDNGSRVELNRLSRLEVLSANPAFKTVDF
ncbi:Rho-binding antiterminator [Methylomarinum vadi]|uniref:Rho-binding antiterminator n=1 Tax=Methylomarinum vadi TaxID=438855 RepID=UPI0004DF5C65|nr:Rho-binding antiterminator [Methylomarinum vadi]